MKTCLSCNTELLGRRAKYNKYCDNKCQAQYQYNKFISAWKEGRVNSGVRIKKYIIETKGYSCAKCGISEWQSEPITLELEHIDGDSENNREENLCLLCPNCHSQTPTYKAKNKGNGRYVRRNRYKEGKSF